MDTNHSGLCSEELSFVNGTNDREAHSKFWIAALVNRLNKLGFETYFPYPKEKHQWSDCGKAIGIWLFR